MEFEKGLIVRISELGRLLVSLFLWMRQEYWQGSGNNVVEEGEKRQGLKPRKFGTVFGKVKYWRTYLYREKEGGGRYSLDIELGIPWDGFSMQVRSLATRIATKTSYAQTVAVLCMFLHWSPCQKTVEEMVPGLGRHTGEWFKTGVMKTIQFREIFFCQDLFPLAAIRRGLVRERRVGGSIPGCYRQSNFS